MIQTTVNSVFVQQFVEIVMWYRFHFILIFSCLINKLHIEVQKIISNRSLHNTHPIWMGSLLSFLARLVLMLLLSILCYFHFISTCLIITPITLINNSLVKEKQTEYRYGSRCLGQNIHPNIYYSVAAFYHFSTWNSPPPPLPFYTDIWYWALCYANKFVSNIASQFTQRLAGKSQITDWFLIGLLFLFSIWCLLIWTQSVYVTHIWCSCALANFVCYYVHHRRWFRPFDGHDTIFFHIFCPSINVVYSYGLIGSFVNVISSNMKNLYTIWLVCVWMVTFLSGIQITMAANYYYKPISDWINALAGSIK